MSPSLNCIFVGAVAGMGGRTVVGRTVGGGGALGTETAAALGRPVGGVDIGRGALERVRDAVALATFRADFGAAEGRAERARAERRDMLLGTRVVAWWLATWVAVSRDHQAGCEALVDGGFGPSTRWRALTFPAVESQSSR